MYLRAGGRVLELDDPTSSSMAPIFSDTWLGTELWPAARALVALLEERRPMLAAATQVLELGAGTGACGLAAAALGARRVLLTDKPVLLPVMRANVTANVFDSCVIECVELTWRSPGDESRSPGDESEEHGTDGTLLHDRLPAGADLVLASDCLNPVYGLGHAAALAATIHDALSLSAAALQSSALHTSRGAGSMLLAAAAVDDGGRSTAVPEALLAQTRRGDMCAEADFFAACDRLGLAPTLLRLTAVLAEGGGDVDGGGGDGEGGGVGEGGGEGGCRVRTLEGEAEAAACTAQVVALYSIRLRAAGSGS